MEEAYPHTATKIRWEKICRCTIVYFACIYLNKISVQNLSKRVRLLSSFPLAALVRSRRAIRWMTAGADTMPRVSHICILRDGLQCSSTQVRTNAILAQLVNKANQKHCSDYLTHQDMNKTRPIDSTITSS